MAMHDHSWTMHYHGVHALSLIIMHDYVVFFMLFSILSNLVQHTIALPRYNLTLKGTPTKCAWDHTCRIFCHLLRDVGDSAGK